MKIMDILSGIPMTIIGGIFLALSLGTSLSDIAMPIDPAWMTIAICGIPLLHLAIWRLMHNKGIS